MLNGKAPELLAFLKDLKYNTDEFMELRNSCCIKKRRRIKNNKTATDTKTVAKLEKTQNTMSKNIPHHKVLFDLSGQEMNITGTQEAIDEENRRQTQERIKQQKIDTFIKEHNAEKEKLKQQLFTLTGGYSFEQYQRLKQERSNSMNQEIARECPICFGVDGNHEMNCTLSVNPVNLDS